MILMGTSGFSYEDWRGPFYPAGLGKNRMLDAYAEVFPAVEINATYYRTPGQRTAEGLVERAAGRLRFAIKAPGDLTHKRRLDAETLVPYRRFLEPFRQAECLDAILFQFPNALRNSAPSREFLRHVHQEFGDLPLAFEFRHESWDHDDVDDQLRTWAVSRVGVDQPDLPGLSRSRRFVRTAPLAYVRFHGRNAADWYGPDSGMNRYTYTYNQEELFETAAPIKAMAEKAQSTFVFFNNHPEGGAPQNALLLGQLLGLPRRHSEQTDLFG
ncbi:MAG: DUF72 domain-containing protein [Sumerlaeia bacterium]